jgi:hypothetical protein
MATIKVFHISDNPMLAEPNGYATFMRNHDYLKKEILRRRSKRNASSYESDLLVTLRNIDRIGENVNKLIDQAVGDSLSSLHPHVGKISEQISQFNSRFDSVRNLLKSNDG